MVARLLVSRVMPPTIHMLAASQPNDDSITLPARPSSPSIMFTALITPSTANTVNGSASTARRTCTPGSSSPSEYSRSPSKKSAIATTAACASSLRRAGRPTRSSWIPIRISPRAPSAIGISGFLMSATSQVANSPIAMPMPPTTGVGTSWVQCPRGCAISPHRGASAIAKISAATVIARQTSAARSIPENGKRTLTVGV